MPITPVTKTVEGNPVRGFQITCSTEGCPQTSFVSAQKRLPMLVVTKKFQERHWEVEKRHSTCPTCVGKRRVHKTHRAPMVQHLEPVYEKLPLTPGSLTRIITEIGLGGVKITELQGKTPRFKIVFPTPEVPHGKIMSAEGQILTRCEAQIDTSYFKTEISQEPHAHGVTIQAHMTWVLGLAPSNSMKMAAE